MKPMSKVVWALVSASTLFGAMPLAQAADAPAAHYAVMSLVGDRLTVVHRRDQTGSSLDRNDETALPIPDASLDNVALLAVNAGLQRFVAQDTATLLTSRDPQLFALEDAMARDPEASTPLLDALRAQVQSTKATRLILVTKYRGEARMPMAHGDVGAGKLLGLGFYIDDRAWIKMRSTGARDQGYIAPYAYLTLNLVDVDSMRVIKRVVLPEARVVPTAASATAETPWDTMSSQKKIEAVERMIRGAVARGLPQLMEGG